METRSSTVPEWFKFYLEQQEQNRAQERAQHLEQLRLIADTIGAGATRQQDSNIGQPNATEHLQQTKVSNQPRPPLLDSNITYSKFIAWRESWDD